MTKPLARDQVFGDNSIPNETVIVFLIDVQL
jgi:hypothetical protein